VQAFRLLPTTTLIVPMLIDVPMETPTMLNPAPTTRSLRSLWWMGILTLLASPLSAQWVNAWTSITVDKEPAFSLSDSTAVHAVRAADGGYAITKRVWVEKGAVSDGELAAESTLYDAKGQAIGQTQKALLFDEPGIPSDRRMAKKYVTGLIHGHVRSSAFISNSWPERTLVEFLTEKRTGPFWDAFSGYLQTFGFEELKPLPGELDDAGLNAWVLRYQDAKNQDEQRFRMIIFTRGEVGIQCILTDAEVLEIPKLKLQEDKAFGQLHHLAKPTTAQSTGYEYAAYACIPLEGE
jgi:hypothetical protein